MPLSPWQRIVRPCCKRGKHRRTRVGRRVGCSVTMRPILKTATTRDAGLGSTGGGDAAAAGEGRRSARSLFPPAGGARRVTFSPFAVSRRARLARAGTSSRGALAPEAALKAWGRS